MQEQNDLLNILFPDESDVKYKNESRIEEYILKLGTYKVKNLLREPDRLKHDSAVFKEQIQELAVSNYKSFIETAECSRELFFQFNSIENKLDQLIDDMPKFEEKCRVFGEKSCGINDLRKLNSVTLTKSVQLLEILELPQLMNSFITDGLYDDALELAAYVRKLNSKHTDIPIFKSIASDIDRAWVLMLHQLLYQLRQELSLPKSLQIVGHLRRMQVFTESELRVKFLQSRNYWLESSLKSIPREDVTHHLTKTIEVTRVNLFNILTQYRTIFNDDEHSPLLTKNKNVNQNVIFYCWINDKIREFLSNLEINLREVSSIESILDQCMYFGLSFSKVGCDFRTQLIPIFTNRIFLNFDNAVLEAVKAFEVNIEKFTLIDRNHPNIPWKSKSEDPLQPPDNLLEFYPLAEFLNRILDALNRVQLCAPIAIVDKVIKSLQDALMFIAKSLLVLYGQEQQAFTTSSKDAFTRLCMCFSDDLVPYIQKCIHVIFPPSQIASILGITVNQLQQEHVTFLNKTMIVEPIKHLLPVKIKPDTNNVEFKEKLDDNTFKDEDSEKSNYPSNSKEDGDHTQEYIIF